MYPLGSLTAALQNARRKLLNVFEPPDREATRDQRTEGIGKGLGSIGRLTQVKSPTEIPRLTAIVTAILEHGTIPAVRFNPGFVSQKLASPLRFRLSKSIVTVGKLFGPRF